MRHLLSRLAAPLRRAAISARVLNKNGGSTSAKVPFILKGASVALFAVSPELLLDTNVDRHSTDLQQVAPTGLETVFSARDVPRLVVDSVSGVYASAKSAVLKRTESEGGSSIALLTLANVAVYVLWKTAPSGFMVRHFANSLESMRRGRVWTSFTSNFSHMGIFHLTANMYLLNRFGPEVVDIIGRDRFFLFYGTAGVASSLASLAYRRFTKSSVLSLGASGAVVATLWLYACFFPDRRMALIGTDKSLSMQELVLAYTVIDAAGLLGSLGKIDFAAHLGGALFGNSWFFLVRDKLAEEAHQRRREERRNLLPSVKTIFREPYKRHKED